MINKVIISSILITLFLIVGCVETTQPTVENNTDMNETAQVAAEVPTTEEKRELMRQIYARD